MKNAYATLLSVLSISVKCPIVINVRGHLFTHKYETGSEGDRVLLKITSTENMTIEDGLRKKRNYRKSAANNHKETTNIYWTSNEKKACLI